MKREQSSDSRRQDQRRRLRALFAAVISLFIVLAVTSDVGARSSGGRYGGGAGFSQSRSGSSGGGSANPPSAPTSPYGGPSSPGYAPYSSSPGFGFFPFFLLPFWGWGGGMGGGFGFGGILGLLIVLGIVVLIGKVLLQNLGTARRFRLGRSAASPLRGDRYAVVKCQLALLSTARSLQRDLRNYASTATTDTVAGLATALHDVVVAVRRHNEYWKYGTIYVQQVGAIDEAERVFNEVVSQERAKLSEELTANIDGVRRQRPIQERPKADEVGSYLVVTLIIATGYANFTAYHTPSMQEFEATLQRLGTLLASDILALEVMWSPENPDDALTEDELMAEYPELSGL